MNYEIKYAENKYLQFLLQNDDLNENNTVLCIKERKYILATYGNHCYGFLRYTMFWHEIPYMEMIRVIEGYKKQGIGTALLQFWEQEMKTAKILMTSSMKNELEPQQWHKRNGFVESGQINLGNFDRVPEVFFVKTL